MTKTIQSKRHSMFLIIITVLLCFFIFPATAFAARISNTKVESRAESSKVLRVGFPIQYGMTEKNNGRYSGYTYEYLQEISQYTGWEYEFVELEGTSNEVLTTMLDMLEKGELDILGGILMNKYTVDKYDFSGRNYGTAYSTLLVLEENTQLNESNCQSLGKLKIASMATSKLYVENLQKFCDTNKIEYELVPCDTEEEQSEKLHSGEADALLTVDLSEFEGMRSIAKFAPSPFYFATTKGNTDIVSGLNFGIQKINDSDPYFNINLYEKYFGANSAKLILSDDEKNTIEQSQPIIMGTIADKAPFQYKLPENNDVTGVSVSVLEKITKDTGIEFEIKEYSTVERLKLAAQNHEIDGVLGMNYDYGDAKDYGVSLTRAYVSSQMVMVVNKDADRTNFSGKRRAVPADIAYEDDNYNPEILQYADLSACIDAVNSGTADYVYANAYSVEYYARRPEYKNIDLVPQAGVEQKICLGLCKPVDVNILTSINKVICSTGTAEIQSLIFKSTATPGMKISLANLIDSNPRYVVLIFALFTLVVMITVIIIANVRIKASRETALNNKRYVTLAEMSNEFLFEYDYNDDILKLSEKCSEAFGYPKEILQYSKLVNQQIDNEAPSIESLGKIFENYGLHDTIVDEAFYKLGNGERHWFRITCMPVLGEGKTLRYTVGKLVDIQEEVESRGRLIEKTQKDGLTNIYNSTTSREIISDYIVNRQDNSLDVLMIMDVDQFKNVNDNLGHYMGDLVLKDIAKTLMDLSGDGDVVGRFGGDEFIACMKGFSTREEISEKCKQICEAMRRKIEKNNKSQRISVSLGAVVINPEQEFNDIFQKADEALYKVKQNGRDGFELAQ